MFAKPTAARWGLMLSCALALVLAPACGSGGGAPAPAAPTIASQPTDQTALAGDTATFTVTAAGSPAPTYQWQVSANGGADWSSVSAGTGGTTVRFTTQPLTLADSGTQYRAVATNSAGAQTSRAVTLTVRPKPAVGRFTATPAVITAGGSSTLAFSFSGGSGSIDPGVGAVDSDAIATVAPAATTTYTLTVDNGFGATRTATVAVTVVPPPAAPSIQAPAFAAPGQEGLVASVAAQEGMTFEWAITGGSITAGGNTRQVVFTAGARGTLALECRASNAAGASATASAAVTVVDPPVIGAFTATPDAIQPGASSTLHFEFTGGSGSIDPGVGEVTSGVDVVVRPSATTRYKLTVAPSVGNPATREATVTVSSAGKPQITQQPTPQVATVPDGATFTVVASGSNLTYQWYKGGTLLVGETNSSYTTPDTDRQTVPASYKVVVTSDGDSANAVTSDSVTYTLQAPSPTYAGDPVPTGGRLVAAGRPAFTSDPFAPDGVFRFGYEEAVKNPAWTAYADFKVGSAYANSDRSFKPDTRLEAPQVQDADYGSHGGTFYKTDGSGYDRGHMVPMSDIAYHHGDQAGDDSCRMSNVIPQVSFFNQRIWLQLEGAVGGTGTFASFNNGLAATFRRVWIYTGPIYTGTTSYWLPDSNTYTTDPSALPSGTRAIAIPAACYKIVVAAPAEGRDLPRAFAWIGANRVYASSENADLWKYVSSVAQVETLTGLDFFPGLPHGDALSAWKSAVDIRGWGAPFEDAVNPNVHIVNPSWDTTVAAGTPVTFRGAYSSASGTFQSATWSFSDDGSSSAEAAPAHTFSRAGTFTVTYTVAYRQADASLRTKSLSRTVAVTGTGTNAPPSITGLSDQTGAADAPLTVSFSVSDDTTPAGNIAMTASSDNTTLLPTPLAVANAAGSCTLVLTPAAGVTGSAVITVQADDGQSGLSTRTFTYTASADLPPTLTGLGDLATTVDVPATATFTVSDDHAEAGAINVGAVTDNPSLLPTPLVVTNSAGSCSLTLSPAAGQTGTANVTVTASDGSQNTVRTFAFTVHPGAGTVLNEDFETGSKTAYASAPVTFASGDWTLTDTLIAGASNRTTSDRLNGTQGLRMQNKTTGAGGKLTMNFDWPRGAKTVSVQYAKYGTDGDGTFGLWSSVDGGTTWQQTDPAVYTSSNSALATATWTLNINKPVRLELRRTDAVDAKVNKRVNLDDLVVTGY